MKAIVFAAGLGTRLRPVTDHIPKALVQVGGVTMLERVIRKVRAAGIDEIVVNAHHFADKVEDFLAGNPEVGSGVRISREEGEALETGGGVRHARTLLEGSGSFLMHNVDILSDMDLKRFIASHESGVLATLAVQEAEADRYFLFDDGMRLVGWTNVRTGEVKSPYPGLDPSRFRRLSFCGVHILSDEVFPLMEGWPDKFGIVDFYLSAAATHTIRGVIQKDLHLIDIGSPGKLAEAEAACKSPIWGFSQK